MSPATAVAIPTPATKTKKPSPIGSGINGVAHSTASSSPSLANKKMAVTAKPPASTAGGAAAVPTVRPVNRARRDVNPQALGRHSRNSAGKRTGSMSEDASANGGGTLPYVVSDSYILSKHAGNPPSLVVHLHATHFRFDGQDGMFPYKSPMKLFLEHVRSRTIPHDLLEYFIQAKVQFYDGCLIVQLHDHKSAAQSKDVARPTSASSKTVPASIHNYNQWLTPSPYVPFPQEEQGASEDSKKAEEETKPTEGEKSEENGQEETKLKIAAKPKVFTVVLHPTPESLHIDLMIKATTPKGIPETYVPPPTPLSLGNPPTPTVNTMPPPAKRQRRDKTELDGSNIYVAEGQILLATMPSLILTPTKNVEEMIALLEAMSHPKHAEAPPQPKTRKRTIAEVAADEAAAADHERYMLVLDERLSSGIAGGQGTSGADGDAQNGSVTFEPRFERFKTQTTRN
ncbi:SAGA complex subunit spt20 [Beauveria bassiana]|uniref:SAGA complex subunit spt20 n=1 Tax=Beauveria bassiana TaxID=176275 RepID=A0A2N6P2T8_BEABA|nr:SAGA complex subunit spt20 [Beauveria bassiana]